mmetsp:Transcript_32107/g.37744  ORF Transcript_32107/g.37744 Transcript_32107/m.37744 type:complete len:134 (+) Transcript_32107:109-510(+)
MDEDIGIRVTSQLDLTKEFSLNILNPILTKCMTFLLIERPPSKEILPTLLSYLSSLKNGQTLLPVKSLNSSIEDDEIFQRTRGIFYDLTRGALDGFEDRIVGQEQVISNMIILIEKRLNPNQPEVDDDITEDS